jgi:hypothetical protein
VIKNYYLAKSENGFHIADAIASHMVIAVSDGSQKASMGTCTYVLEGSSSIGCIIGVNIAPGNITLGDSQRYELTSIFDIILLGNLLCEAHSISLGSITVGCDNLLALQVLDYDYSFSPTQKDFDLLSAIQWKIRHIPIQWYGHNVYGHQDDLEQPLDR